jgi:O-antigen/teichoic acid export membrane protein
MPQQLDDALHKHIMPESGKLTGGEAARPVPSLRQQSVWLLTAKIVGFGFSFLLPLIIVRYLDQEQVGNYRQAFLVITNAAVILPLGFSMSAYYFLARERERRGAAILNILLFNFVVGGAACLALNLWPQVLGNLFQADEMTRLAPKIGFVIWIWIFSTFLETVAIANQEPRAATVFIVLAQFSKTLLMAAAVFAFASVEAFVWAAMVQGIIQGAVLLWYLRSRFPRFWVGWNANFFWEQMVYAVPFGLTGILWIAQTDIHNYFVGYKFSSSDFAIYAYGCFEIPLISMLAESVNSVLIPRMNVLQMRGDREEMIRLTTRAMSKLAFAYFPIYAFLLITATTFITTLFTQKYAASATVFIVNITLLPFAIFVTDPIVRSFKELGRLFLLTRILVLTCLVGVLYFGLDSFGLRGMITTAVGAVILERCISFMLVAWKVGLKWQHLRLLRNVARTAAAAAVAGVLTWAVYANVVGVVPECGGRLAAEWFAMSKPSVLSFVGGALVLTICGIVFLPTYLVLANILGVIDTEEKEAVRKALRRFVPFRARTVPEGV